MRFSPELFQLRIVAVRIQNEERRSNMLQYVVMSNPPLELLSAVESVNALTPA